MRDETSRHTTGSHKFVCLNPHLPSPVPNSQDVINWTQSCVLNCLRGRSPGPSYQKSNEREYAFSNRASLDKNRWMDGMDGWIASMGFVWGSVLFPNRATKMKTSVSIGIREPEFPTHISTFYAATILARVMHISPYLHREKYEEISIPPAA